MPGNRTHTHLTHPKDREPPTRVDSHQLFDRISARYDLLNHLLSFGLDLVWRRRVSRTIRQASHRNVLDLACGTCDLILSAVKHNPDIQLGIGIDMAEKMLARGRKKLIDRSLDKKIELVRGDGMCIPLVDHSIDFGMIAFGIRNMTDPAESLSELYRVLRPGGRVVVLEFSLPEYRPFRVAYLFYFRYILPIIGGIISGDRYAYRYLNRTVETFPHGTEFSQMVEKTGFSNLKIWPLSFGIATIYCGDKR